MRQSEDRLMVLPTVHFCTMFDINIDYLPDEKIIQIVTRGTLDLAADRELVAAAKAAAKKYGTLKFLIDHRYVELKMRLIEAEDVPMITERAGVSPKSFIALLHSKTPEAMDLFSFVENISSLKNGPSRMTFTDRAEAIKWLNGCP